MLFHIRMDVNLPSTMPPEQSAQLKADEKAMFQGLQASGKWRHIWRIAGHYANISVFDVASVEELHATLSALPLFPYMTIAIAPLCRHPSSLHEDDR
ncbi:muconolactone Delta-isomerase [Janthinobacterium psychrotolerans]|uniref:Muconolactone Delta-isomerase n=1 Tax=Janthinobacterium psychrotolerans TaxID=1747903 RepID=A0A1A7BY85_9BURK|nr:muconolactone Delta-isomerase [Janthinobacterium psychrotolerans]OBV38591.1 muconolactone D-isomerase [Janthinobacterium psychrotolerans]